jgi:RNA polymerase sigma-70 factor (ECF subfamily)
MGCSGIEVLMVAVMKEAGLPTPAEFHQAISNRSNRWYSACLRITHSPELAEDAVQEALLSAWAKRHQFNNTARLETWIHRIAINSALQLLRKNRHGIFEPLETDVSDDAGSPELAQHNRDIDNEVSKALHTLSEIERVCFVLKHLEQWRLKEIAEEFDINVGAVKQAVFRAVRKLRVRLDGMQGEHHE